MEAVPGSLLKSGLMISATQALVHSNARLKDDEKDPRGSIVQKTHGIFFMGTPHQGGLGADIAQVILKVAGVFMQTNDAHLKVLVPGSEELRGLNKEYFAVAKRWGFDTKLCYEDRKTQVLRNGPAKWVSHCVPGSSFSILIYYRLYPNPTRRCHCRIRSRWPSMRTIVVWSGIERKREAITGRCWPVSSW